MTRKDYELIARCLKGAVDAHGQAASILLAVDNFAMELRHTNPRFDEQRFRAACGAPQMKEVTNLMSGKKVTIPADTPLCCDPSSETYWSM